ncbi:MAG TPA: hypothetical protein VHO02_00285, partial [Fibrobacteria bacterium]|nr:hypothetical protein [Fibrobacteria bacterium]
AMYKLAWESGLKTTYYLRALGATQAEKSTLNRTRGTNAVSSGGAPPAVSEAEAQAALEKLRAEARPEKVENPEGAALACSILNGEDCEACQ